MPFEIVRNDLIKMHVDAIVNPTDAQFSGSGGVDQAIHRIEGSMLKAQTDKIGQLEAGKSALTKAYKLPAGHIIHTVGPIWNRANGRGEEILTGAYRSALALAKSQGFESIAFPLIASGAYGCPKDVALTIGVTSIREFLDVNDMMVYLVVYDRSAYQLSEDLYGSVKAYIDDNYRDEAYVKERVRKYRPTDNLLYEASISQADRMESFPSAKSHKKSLEEVVNQLDETFSEMLLRLIDESGLKDPEVYKKANVTKQTFSKIRNNRHYNPTKPTVLAFAIALELNLDAAKDLLLKSGYALSKSSRFDVIISYFLESETYDIYEINEVLFAYDEQLLGV